MARDNFDTTHGEGQETFVHELGHAFGLGHTGNYNGSGSTYADAQVLNYTGQYSTMSYWQPSNYPTPSGVSDDPVMTLQLTDVQAIYDIYGSDISAFSGNTSWGNNGDSSAYNDILLEHSDISNFTIVDTGGIDSFDLYTANGTQVLSLNPGTFSSINGGVDNIAIALNTIIENAYGSDNVDHITGNDAANEIWGRGPI